MIQDLSLVSLIVAFVGGIASFVSPCVLPLVPIFLGHLSGVSIKDGQLQGGRTTFLHSLGFVIGFSVPFIILGATVGVLGGTAGGYGDLIARIAGALLIAVGLYMAGVFKLPVLRTVLGPLTNWLDGIYFRERRIHIGGEDAPPSYWRSTIVGGAFGVGWTPCITPLLGAILTLAFNEAGNSLNAWSAAGQATILLAFYTAGLSIPFLITGAALGQITPIFKKVNRYLPAITVASGILMVLIGLLIFFNQLTKLNEYFSFLESTPPAVERPLDASEGFTIYQSLGLADTPGGEAGAVPGKLAPNFRFTSDEGEEFSLAELRGQPVIVNFWATWCGPCRAEMPDLQRVHDTLGDELTLLAVDLDETGEAVTAFFDEIGLALNVVIDDGRMVADQGYGLFGVPSTYVIDADGVVVATKIGPYANIEEINGDLEKIGLHVDE